MEQTTETQDDQKKQVWRALRYLAYGALTTMSMAVAFIYKQKSDNDQATIQYERGQKEYFSKGWQRCQDDRLNDNMETEAFRREELKTQDSVKNAYKLQ